MKIAQILFTIIASFIISASLMFLASTSDAQVCQLKLVNLSQFQDEDAKRVESLALLNYLTKENRILFAPIHYQATYDVCKKEVPKFKDFIASYPIFTAKQQTAVATKVWNALLHDSNPLYANIPSKDSWYSTSPETISGIPKTAAGFLDLDALSLSDMNIIRTYAKSYGFTYEEFLKNHQILETIDRNPELKAATINLISISLKETAKIGKSWSSQNIAKTRWKDLNGGWFNLDPKFGPDATGMRIFGNVIATVAGGAIGGGLLSDGGSHATYGVPVGLAVAGTIPLIYSSIRVPQIAYNSAKVKIKSFFEKRRLRKVVTQNDQKSDNGDEGEE